MRRLLLALCRCRLGLCSTHCLHPSTYSMTTYKFFTTAPGAVQSRAHPSKTTCRRMSRLSLRKGEGEGEGSFGHLGGASFKPLTSILSPSPRGQATETD